MAQYITHLDVSTDKADKERLKSQGYMKIDVNLNKGAGGNTIYLWYKRGSQNPITRVQVTFNEDMAGGFTSAGYTKIRKDLNAGAKGDAIYLWYYRGSGEFHTPIVNIDVTTDAESDAEKVSLGWEALAYDLNSKARESRIGIWVKREPQTYLCDVTATDSFSKDADNWKNGYIRFDCDTNGGAGGKYVFIWYRQTTNLQGSVTDLAISSDEAEHRNLQQQHYQVVNVQLNEGTGDIPVYLWYKKDGSHNPIKTAILLLQPDKADMYQKKGFKVIKKVLHAGIRGKTECLCVFL